MIKTENGAIITATNDYLGSIDRDNPPIPSELEHDLLEETRQAIGLENAALPKGEKLKMPKQLSTWQVAQVLMCLYTFRNVALSGKDKDVSFDVLMMYETSGADEGIYVEDEKRMRRLARQYNINLTKHECDEIKSYIEDDVERVKVSTKRNLVPVNNGIFDYDTKQLMPFSSEYVFTSKCRVDYVPNPINPVIHNPNDGTDWDVESWMHTLSDDDDVVDLLWEITGAIIRPNVSWNKMALLYSEAGNNGKGTLCELMRELCGEGTYASVKLSDMGKDFALEPLIRTSAIIVDENDVGTFIDKVANLKALITHDVVPINRKFKQGIAYRWCGFMVQCINEMPRIKDKSDSFYRRQLFVPFTKCFTGNERKYIKDDYLHRQDVLEYVLNKVLNMNYYDLSEPDACRFVLEEYKEFNDPIRGFWEEIKDQLAWDLVPNAFLYDLYRAWYSKNIPTGSPIGKNTFIKEIEKNADPSVWEYKKGGMKTLTRMDKPELLIAQYGLRDWMNMRFAGTTDLTKLCIPCNTATRYKGLHRLSDETDDSDDSDTLES